MRITEELLWRKSRGSGLENRDQRPQGSIVVTTQHPLSTTVGSNLAGRSVGIVHLHTKSHKIVHNMYQEMSSYFIPLTPENWKHRLC
jgi:hypothetical protein